MDLRAACENMVDIVSAIESGDISAYVTVSDDTLRKCRDALYALQAEEYRDDAQYRAIMDPRAEEWCNV
jgi:hypothetical protein